MTVFGLILAGGQATRMGGVDKSLLPLRNRTILDFVLERMRPQVAALAVSANGDPARFAAFGCPVLADSVEGRGPLGGVLRGLEWAEEQGADALLTIPGDTPFIPADLAARLSPPPACAENATGVHFPVALWPVWHPSPAPSWAGSGWGAEEPQRPIPLRNTLADWLAAQNSGRVSAFGALIGLRKIWFPDPGNPFQNINTPADLEAAQRNV